MSDITVLGISGSLRAGSFNSTLLRHAQGLAPAGMKIDVYGGLRAIPPYDEDEDTERESPAVADLRARIAAADALLIATPEYNYGVPGVLKNALDWASRAPGRFLPLQHTPVAIMGASPTPTGTVRAQLALRQFFLWNDSAVVTKPEVAVAAAHEKLGAALDPRTEQAVRGLLDALAAKVRHAALITTAA
ncbi:NADPH-dependent FMN reductase [Rhizomonospora bruguierae]|uniref:NADPH-dependent FMN reductase n=1 Tax=Rhizomonospora bruguierae TaxID=1581705 RepID=UPI001BCA9B2A|nr:NADPH-dependent FMN reductase [Micromonospora sp. NBRC 107566]